MILKQTSIFVKWFKKLDFYIQSVIDYNVEKLEKGNFANCKSIGEGVHELKIDFQKGYRIYFKNSGQEIILLLCAGSKSSQEKDIQKAKELNKIL